ncbi:MAG: DVUA0089 family protein [Proteobacteria bacterium]|nr:DVUA0089 family protein [Pseudomonadota bacterium]
MIISGKQLQNVFGVIALTIAGAMFMIAPAFASSVITGTLHETQQNYGNTVDHWLITVNTSGTIIFDVLSAENNGDFTWQDGTAGNIETDIDVNGDGEFAYFDSEIFLAQHNGSEWVFIEGDDDGDSNQGISDGSLVVNQNDPTPVVFTYDSYITINLDVGSYLLLVGTYNADQNLEQNLQNRFNAFLTGSVEQGDYPTLFREGGLASDHGDYQVTITGDISASPVPVPGAILLFGSGLLALVRIRRKKY